MLNLLRSGDWITKERLGIYPLIMLAAMVFGIAFLLSSSQGMLDKRGEPLGTDFSNVWNAGAMVLEGRAGEAYNPKLHYQKQQETFGNDVQFYGWHYPPMFLALAGALAMLPYLVSLLVWLGSTLALYLASFRVMTKDIVPEPKILISALAFPTVFINLGHGQNAFLTAALIGSGLFLLDKKPVMAGILIGLLSYKPHFGLLIPLALAVTGRWPAFMSAAVTVLLLVLATTALWGTQIWFDFLHFSSFTKSVVLEQGATGWEKIQSVFSVTRSLGFSVGAGYAVQAVLALAVTISTILLWRSKAAYELKAAALILGCLLITPYSLDYDLMLMMPAMVFMVRYGLEKGFADYEKSLLAVAWFVPFMTRGIAEFTFVPLGVMTLLALYAMVMAKAWVYLGEVMPFKRKGAVLRA